jgi:hypothetical protein
MSSPIVTTISSPFDHQNSAKLAFCHYLCTPYPYANPFAIAFLNEHVEYIKHIHSYSEESNSVRILAIEFKLRNADSYTIDFFTEIGERSADNTTTAMNIHQISLTGPPTYTQSELPFIFACGLDSQYSGTVDPSIGKIIVTPCFRYMSHSLNLSYIFDKYNFLKPIPHDCDMIELVIKNYPMPLEHKITLILAFIAYPTVKSLNSPL